MTDTNENLREAAAALGRKGRAVNSPAQQDAARANGRGGGRPVLYERLWTGSGGRQPIFTIAKVSGGRVIDAWVIQIGGNVRSSGGAEAEVMGKTVEQLLAMGFSRR